MPQEDTISAFNRQFLFEILKIDGKEQTKMSLGMYNKD